jgi:hypothetical protein
MNNDELVKEVNRLRKEIDGAYEKAAAEVSVHRTKLSQALEAYSAQASQRIHAEGVDSIFGLSGSNNVLREHIRRLLALTNYWEQFLPRDMIPFEELSDEEQRKYYPQN